jgi:hypothetical protein
MAQAQSANIAATVPVIRFAILTKICPSFAGRARLALTASHARFNYRSCARHPKLVGELGVCVASAHESDWRCRPACATGARITSSSQDTVPVFCTAKRIESADAQSPDVQNAAPVQSQAITIGMVNLVWAGVSRNLTITGETLLWLVYWSAFAPTLTSHQRP